MKEHELIMKLLSICIILSMICVPAFPCGMLAPPGSTAVVPFRHTPSDMTAFDDGSQLRWRHHLYDTPVLVEYFESRLSGEKVRQRASGVAGAVAQAASPAFY